MKERNLSETICFCITSCIPTVPCDCDIPDALRLSVKSAAYDVFYLIYEDGARLNLWTKSRVIRVPSPRRRLRASSASTLRRRSATWVVVRPGSCYRFSGSMSSWNVG